jgi:hypothetical protein
VVGDAVDVIITWTSGKTKGGDAQAYVSFKGDTLSRVPDNISPVWLEGISSDKNATFDVLQTQVQRSQSPERNKLYADGRLTERGAEQIGSGERVCSNLDVQFLGDVWDRPVCSYESRWAVQGCKFLADQVNRVLGVETSAQYRQRIFGASMAPGATSSPGKKESFRIDTVLRHLASYFALTVILVIMLLLAFTLR